MKLRNGDASMVRIELISCLRNKVRETEQSQTTKERKGDVLGFHLPANKSISSISLAS